MADRKHPPNRLAQESSPYLAQHAYNPVDWFPWGQEALEAARKQDRPILLSVGYSACHWCHVMEHESFEDEEVAHLMNEKFINIKVDREERPDIDAIYMNYVQMTTGSGGWPLTVFLAPSQVPFYGGTYFPPGDHYGRPSFRKVLESVSAAYQTRRAELDSMSQEVVNRLRQASAFDSPSRELDDEIAPRAAEKLAAQFDRRFGGFGDAPKFPSSMALAFLLRHYQNTGHQPVLDMVTLSLDRMADGGIYDHLGGGFHRYTVDEKWLVPHFEKMLYDNALLARLYLEAWQVTGSRRYRLVTEETLEWVARELLHEEGGFLSAQDADSEGEEGRFYVWSVEQVEQKLGDISEVFRDFFDVTSSGNFEGANILNRRYPLGSFAAHRGLSPDSLGSELDDARIRLRETRQQRVAPGTDDKVLTSWNGLMNSAFSRAGFAFGRADLTEIAIRNAEFLWQAVRTPDGELRRSWKNGEAKLNAYLEDYAAVCGAFLNLFETTGQRVWLDRAQELMEKQQALFWDDDAGDFYFTGSNHEELLVRHKEHMDNATPSGNSVSCLNLLRLSQLTGEAAYQETASRMLCRVGLALSSHPLAFGNWLHALDFLQGDTLQIVLAGDAFKKFLPAVQQSFLPNSIIFQINDSNSDLPLAAGKPSQGPARVYLCQNYQCERPVSEVEELKIRLRK